MSVMPEQPVTTYFVNTPTLAVHYIMHTGSDVHDNSQNHQSEGLSESAKGSEDCKPEHDRIPPQYIAG